MKKISLVVLLLCSAFAWAGGKQPPNPSDYTVNVHVSYSGLPFETSSFQKLNVIIDGKKYELRSNNSVTWMLAPGNYKAKLVQDNHKTPYQMEQIYEFLFPDNKTAKFRVVGITE
jgi:hypothetical protein